MGFEPTCPEPDKLCITFSGSAAEGKKAAESGMDAVAVGIDSIVIKEAYSRLVAEVRG